MVFRVCFAAWLLSASLTTLAGGQITGVPRTNSFNPSLQGRVLDPDGRPLAGVHVELDKVTTAVPVASTFTQPDGTFALYNIPQGAYEIVADSANSDVSQALALASPHPFVELRFAPAQPSQAAPAATISVAHLQVPEKALAMYSKARNAFQRGHIADAQKWVNHALLIETEFAAALALRGFISMQAHNLDAAEHDLEHATQIDSSLGSAYVALAAVYNHQGRVDDAWRAAQRATALSPQVWQGYFEMARSALSKGRYLEALEFASRAERQGGGGFYALHLVKAGALYSLKMHNDARYEAQQALARSKGADAQPAQTLLAEINATTTKR